MIFSQMIATFILATFATLPDMSKYWVSGASAPRIDVLGSHFQLSFIVTAACRQHAVFEFVELAMVDSPRFAATVFRRCILVRARSNAGAILFQ